MDLNKLTMPEKIISVSAIVLFIASFLSWFTLKASVAGFSASSSGNGWDVGFLWGGVPTILGLVMLTHVILSKLVDNVSVPDLPWPRIHLVAGVVAAALVVLKLLVGEDTSFPGIEINRAFGLFLAAIAAIGLAVGGFLYYKEHEGSSAPTM